MYFFHGRKDWLYNIVDLLINVFIIIIIVSVFPC